MRNGSVAEVGDTGMTNSLNPAAVDHLPPFITAPGGTDILMLVAAVILIGTILAIGLIFLRLHTMPERMAHKSKKLQFEIVAVLGLLSLFTHEHLYWVAGLLLAFIEIPDFGTPMGRIADSVETIAGTRTGDSATQRSTEADSYPTEKGA